MKQIILIGSWFLVTQYSLAQDIHYSQYYHSPLNLNPALAGQFDGNIRGVANHRSQWVSISEPFVTSSLSVDMRLLQGLLDEDAIGIGMALLTDKSGVANLRYLKVMFTASYHKVLGANNYHGIGLGGQAGFFQHRIDQTKLIFASQFKDTDFDISIPSGEDVSDFNILKADYQAGISYDFDNGSTKINGGFSFFHLTRPNESLLEELDKLSLRSSFQGGAQFRTGERTSIGPDVLVMYQNKAKEINIGGILEYSFDPESTNNIKLITGSSYRIADAIVVMVGGEYKKWRAAISYDINVSSLVKASNYRGGFELSLIYIDRWLTSEKKLPVILPCPRL